MAKIKWTEQDVIEHVRELKNPFEKQEKPNLADFGEKIKAILQRKPTMPAGD